VKRHLGPLLRRILREIVTPPALIIAAVLFLWEEVLWLWFGRIMDRIGRLPPVARIEARIRTLTPYAALATFMVPLALTYPPKFVALWLMATDHFWVGTILLAVLEVVAAALLARVYTLCKPALLTLGWFARGEALVKHWSTWAHERLGIRKFRQAMSEAAGSRRASNNRDFDTGGLT
jgi:hypothetical protein